MFRAAGKYIGYSASSVCQSRIRRLLGVPVRTSCCYRTRYLALAGALLGSCGVSANEPPQPAPFERDVWPILAANCVACHGAEKPKGGLDLRSVPSILRGGENGAAIVKNDAEASLMVERVTAGEMPPDGKRKLTADEVAIVRAWIQ